MIRKIKRGASTGESGDLLDPAIGTVIGGEGPDGTLQVAQSTNNGELRTSDFSVEDLLKTVILELRISNTYESRKFPDEVKSYDVNTRDL